MRLRSPPTIMSSGFSGSASLNEKPVGSRSASRRRDEIAGVQRVRRGRLDCLEDLSHTSRIAALQRRQLRAQRRLAPHQHLVELVANPRVDPLAELARELAWTERSEPVAVSPQLGSQTRLL